MAVEAGVSDLARTVDVLVVFVGETVAEVVAAAVAVVAAVETAGNAAGVTVAAAALEPEQEREDCIWVGLACRHSRSAEVRDVEVAASVQSSRLVVEFRLLNWTLTAYQAAAVSNALVETYRWAWAARQMQWAA